MRTIRLSPGGWSVAAGVAALAMLASAAARAQNSGGSTTVSPTRSAVVPATPPGAPADFSPDRTRTVRDLDGSAPLSGDGGSLRPQKIYFPPNPPPLGVEIAFGNLDRRAGAPVDLAPHVLQPFYAPLSTRIASRAMTRKHEQFLARHRETKAALLEELRAQLRAVEYAGPTARLHALEAFAREQTPRIAAWEQAADEFRRDLYASGLGAGAGNWYAQREWKLGRGSLKKPREETLFLEQQLVRAAVFYQEGLSPAQRRLLREAALALEERVFRQEEDPVVAGWFTFFSPDLARVHFPAELPAGVAVLLETFRREKDVLKQELTDAIYENDKVMFASARDRAMEELAHTQAPRLAALEDRAEEIRRALSGHPAFAVSAAPADLPAGLVARITEFEREKRALQRDLSDRIRAITRTMPPPYRGDASPDELREWDRQRTAAVERETEQFKADNAEHLAALDVKLEAIRDGVEEVAGADAAYGLSGGFDAFLAEFLTSRKQQTGFREYHLAVFEPGLSPEQRRLLFDAAITALELPLPGPEEQPTALPGTILK